MIVIISSYFFFSVPIFLYYGFPIFLFGTFTFFIVGAFSYPFILHFSDYLRFNSSFFSSKSTVYLPITTSKTTTESASCLRGSSVQKNSYFFPKNFNNFSVVKPISLKFKRFTIYPFFNKNLRSVKLGMIKSFYSKYYYSYSSLRFKNKLNDIRQFTPIEGPAVYNLVIPSYDSERIGLFPIYEELEDLLETEIELEFGPDFENANDPFIPLEHNDEWEQRSPVHFYNKKFNRDRSSYIINSSPDIDFDLRPNISFWLQNEAGRVWILKYWLRFLNPKFSNSPVNFITMESYNNYTYKNLSSTFYYLLTFFKIYFSFLEKIFNFFFAPRLLRRFSHSITFDEFNFFLTQLTKFERPFFTTSSSYTSLLRLLFSLETFFINNEHNISFETKALYFSSVFELLKHFYGISNNFLITFSSSRTFITKCLIFQLSRISGARKTL